MNSKLIIVSNTPPIADFQKGSGPTSAGGLASAVHRVAMETKATWIFATDSGLDLANYESPKSLDYTLMPISVSKKEYRSYYGGYCNGLIWPLFHYFPEKCIFSDEDWANYQSVNKKFAMQIVDSVEDNPDATIWIQDYHLLLVAKYLRQFGVKNRIGFFMHIPFPTYEVFRLIPQREEILRAMLHIDLVGLHTKSYVTNFFRSVKNIVKDAEIMESSSFINYNQRKIEVKDFPISVDAEMITETVKLVREKPSIDLGMVAANPNIRIGLGVDRLDYTKGIYERLRAIEFFLKKNSKYRGKFTFIQIAVPSRASVPDYQKYKSKCEEIISRINGQYATLNWQPIIYINKSIPFEDLISYFQIADFALVSPLRDGMNLVAKEFILACKANASLILSELTGAAEELNRVALVNPYNQQQIANMIKYCLENPGYQKAIIEGYRSYLHKNNIHKWSKDFIDEINQLDSGWLSDSSVELQNN